jgi:4-hydroxybenzoate polyprenyltransferase
VRRYWELARPFTLLPPVIGIVSGSVVAYGATGAAWNWRAIAPAALAAAILNAGSNAINQIYDLELDRVNKPHRPLPSGRITRRAAAAFSVVCYAAALLTASLVNRETALIYAAAAVGTWMYSAPPLRLRDHWLWSNFTIALFRGALLKVAGWAVLATVLASWEPWYIGAIFFVFLLGAAGTKDFSDLEGDRRGGARTLPVVFGPRRAAQMIAPSLVAPWVMLPLGVRLGVLHGHPAALTALGGVMFAWGVYTARAILVDPASLVTRGENHPAWRHMYWMMMAAHVGTAAAYWVT